MKDVFKQGKKRKMFLVWGFLCFLKLLSRLDLKKEKGRNLCVFFCLSLSAGDKDFRGVF